MSETWYANLWDEIKRLIETMADFDNTNVFETKKNPPNKFPCAFLVPMDITFERATMTEDFFYPVFAVAFGVQNADAIAGLKQAFTYALQFRDIIATNVHLPIGGTGNWLTNDVKVAIASEWEGMGRGIEHHWVAVILTCEVKM